jgi:hypothetical protein
MSPSSLPDSARRALDLHRLVRDAIAAGCRSVALPPGDHVVSGRLLPERQLWISNNDSGIKPILFDLVGVEDFTLEGKGARILVEGVVVPLVVESSARVVVRDLVIDWVRPAFTEAEVVTHVRGGFEFTTAPGADTFAVNAGRLTAVGGGDWPSGHLYNVLAFDAARREPLARSHESWQIERTHRATDLGGGRFRLEADFSALPPVGGPVVFMHGDRVAPAVVLDRADSVTLQDVTIHHALGMGVIAQACRDLLWQRVRVVPSGRRLFSTWVDAVHAVDCGGSLRVLDCEFRGMFDDGANLHGAHRRVAGWPAPDRVLVEAMHHQQVGVVYSRIGDTLRFSDLATLDRVAEARVTAVRVHNSRFQELTLDRPLPALAGRDLAVHRHEPGQLTEVRGCVIGPNRGRALLLTTPGKIIVEDNRFHCSGNAIEIPPDTAYWWESGAVDDVTITRNVFDACGYAMCGRHLLVVHGPDGDKPIHGTVAFTDNEARLAGGALVQARRLARLEFTGNRLVRHPGYPWLPETSPVDLAGVTEAVVDPLPAFLGDQV